MPIREPIFSRQEQAVVYLVSRHWDDIPAFAHKQITMIQMRFPDASMVQKDKTAGTGEDEAIEFEYALSSFNHFGSADRRTLKDYKSLYIVYWEHDANEEKLRERIQNKLRFTGKVEFVCLNDVFGPRVEPGAECLHACWEFPRRKEICEAYPFSDIEQKTNRLCEQGFFERLTPRSDLYRTIGFNSNNSGFIQCDHWRTIHLFTTGRFGEDSIPSKLFVRPKGHQKFFGYFNIKHAFFIEREGPDVEAYFRKFYFYPYKDSTTGICLVYSQFNDLNSNQGAELYELLKREEYALGQSSELIEDCAVRRQIDRILAK
jgi:hypothetical protein